MAGLASQIADLVVERDAAVRQAEFLAGRLAEAEDRAEECSQAASREGQQVAELRAARWQVDEELAATQERLLRRESSQALDALVGLPTTTTIGGCRNGSPTVRAGGGQVCSSGASPSVIHRGSSGPEGGGAEGSGRGAEMTVGASVVAVALHQRVEALQHIVRIQEHELLRLGECSDEGLA